MHHTIVALGWGWGWGWHKASVLGCLPLAAPIGLSPLLILTLCGSECVLVVSTETLDDVLFDYYRLSQRQAVARAVDQVHPDAHSESMPGLPTPALTCAHCAGVCICGIIFLTGASNNHNDSFPFVLSFSFCTLHRFRRARSALSCYLPLFVPFPVPSGPSRFFLPWGALGGGGACCCGKRVEEGAGKGGWVWVRRTLSPPFP